MGVLGIRRCNNPGTNLFLFIIAIISPGKINLFRLLVPIVGFFALLFVVAFCQQFGWFEDKRRIWSYARVLENALFFTVMYFIVLKQSNAYTIFRYVREQNA